MSFHRQENEKQGETKNSDATVGWEEARLSSNSNSSSGSQSVSE